MLNRPAQGSVVFFVPGGPVGFISWVPGNGSKYFLQATDLGAMVASEVGGRVMVALSSMSDNTFVANVVNPDQTGHWTREYVRKKWQRIYGIGDHAAYLAMLLNWSLGGRRAIAYADEQWRLLHGETGKVVNLNERRIHRGQGGHT